MTPTMINIQTRVEERVGGWVVTSSVNGIPGTVEWGPFTTRSAAKKAAEAVLRNLTEDLDRAIAKMRPKSTSQLQ